MNEPRQERLKKITQSIIALPTLPAVITQLIGIIDNPTTSARNVAQLISTDQALTAKILKLANSAFYGFPREIATVNHAVVVLGFETVKNLALSVSVLERFSGHGESSGFDRQKFWEHSIGCGVAAKMLATKFRYRVSGEVFAAGILHDIGKLVLSQYFPADFGEILDVAQSQGIYIGKAEEQVLGVTHAEVGGWLAERWNLPDQLEESISNHHTPGRLGPRSELTSRHSSIWQIFSVDARTSATEEEKNCPPWTRRRCAHLAFTKIRELPSSGFSVMATSSEKRWKRRMPLRPSCAVTRMTACPVKTGKRLPLPYPHSWVQVASRTVARLSKMIESIQ